MKRSYIEGSKRLFLDRLAVDQQPLLQPGDIDAGPGDPYEYAGVGDSNNFGIGFDCSGLNGIVIGTALFGFSYWEGKGYYRLFSTESFPGPFEGFRQVSKQDLVTGNYPIKVMIGHYGGGPDSHMACVIDGWHMESNGNYGVIGGTDLHRKGINPLDSNYWNDWWVHDGPIEEDTEYRQPMGYPLVLDYAGGPGTGPDGHVSGAVLKANGVDAVCRYLYGLGTSLQYKQLTKPEAKDLQANGIGIVSNFEQGTQNCLGGFSQGVIDAKAGDSVHKSCGGPDNAVIYFSVDYDAPESDQPVINEYFKGIASVIDLQRTAAYGGYWIIKRLFDAGLIVKGWQTEAWSGNNIDSRISLLQRNGLGYKSVDRVQTDINEAHTDDYGAWGQGTQVQAPPVEFPPSDPFIAWYRSASDRELAEYTVAQLGPGDPTWANRGMTLRDFMWEFGNKVIGPKAAPAKKPVKKVSK
jgi:hypothetical protein